MLYWQGDGLTSLFVADSLKTVWEPMALWDVSFQISFMAMLGLILYAERLARWAADALNEDLRATVQPQIAVICTLQDQAAN